MSGVQKPSGQVARGEGHWIMKALPSLAYSAFGEGNGDPMMVLNRAGSRKAETDLVVDPNL